MFDRIAAIEPSTDALNLLKGPLHNFIDGDACSSPTARPLDVINPATGRVVAQAEAGGAADVDRAVQAARRSFDDGVWRFMRPADRARILWRYADLVDRDRDRLAELETIDNGMPKLFAEFTVQLGADVLRYYAGMCDKVSGRNNSTAMSSPDQLMHSYTAKEPIGVVALIVPWNGPIASFLMKVAPALAAGCSCVVKPAENTPVTSLLLARLAAEAGVPAGVLNVVNGLGAEAGAALVAHPGVDKISFTGSTATGKAISHVATERLKRVTLELGGKSPAVIFNDADMDKAIPHAAMGIFGNTGQICIAGSRLFVERRCLDDVLDRLSIFAKGLQIGNGLDPGSQIGPLISQVQLDRVCRYIDEGQAQGATIVTGGSAASENGYFVEPTIFVNAKPDMSIMRDEIFGPVLVVSPFDSEEEVLRAANATRLGLAAGVYTCDLSRAHRFAARFAAGNVWVNCYAMLHPAMPFGGYKESGIGREFGPEGLDAFMETKSIYMAL